MTSIRAPSGEDGLNSEWKEKKWRQSDELLEGNLGFRKGFVCF